MVGKGRIRAIDRTKGLAMLAVICIHADLGEGTAFFEWVVNRAVPILLVSFGLTSELWWERRREALAGGATAEWYASRLRRLLPPAALFGLTWCLAASHFERFPEGRGGGTVLTAMFGYLPWAGTSWFIAAILQLVLVFPALSWAYRSAPTWLIVLAASVVTSVCNLELWTIVQWGSELFGADVPQPAWYYAWIFFPRLLWPVAAGMAVARFGARIGWPLTLACIAGILTEPALIAFIGEPATAAFVGPLHKITLMQLMDVPLALAVLGVSNHAPLPEFVARPLERIGRDSWGIYLGHTLFLELTHLSGVAPELEPSVRWGYAIVLLAVGVGAAWAGGVALTAVTKLQLSLRPRTQRAG